MSEFSASSPNQQHQLNLKRDTIDKKMRNISLFYLIKPVALAFAVPFTLLATKDHSDPDEPNVEPGSPDFWFHIIVSAGLVVLGGVFAGYVLFYFYFFWFYLQLSASNSINDFFALFLTKSLTYLV
jgi:hypothetical protein